MSLTRIQHCTKQQGWALIEVMLALSILTLVFTATIYFMKHAQDQRAAQRTAQEINMVLGASVSYFHDHSETWPSTIKALYPNTSPTHGDYLMASDVKNIWGNSYLIQLTGAPAAPTAELAVGTCVPSRSIARTLAAILPHGTVDTPLTISGGTWNPGCAAGSHYVITHIATVANELKSFDIAIYKTNTEIPMPKCVSGRDPKVFVLPLTIDTGGFPVSAISAYAKVKKAAGHGDPADPYCTYGCWTGHIEAVTSKSTLMKDSSGAATPWQVMAIRDCLTH